MSTDVVKEIEPRMMYLIEDKYSDVINAEHDANTDVRLVPRADGASDLQRIRQILDHVDRFRSESAEWLADDVQSGQRPNIARLAKDARRVLAISKLSFLIADTLSFYNS